MASDSALLDGLDFPSEPTLIHCASTEYRDGTPQAAASCPQSNFLKGCKWSPDGAALLTASEDKWLRIYDLPPDVLEAPALLADDKQHDTLAPALRVYGGELIYDYAWYPGMQSTEPASCVFASTTRAQPLHLWDACTGQKRATYRSYDLMDEIEAAYSTAFSVDGSKLLAGYKSHLCVFDLSKPGRESSKLVTHQRRQDGVPGMVASMACNPDHSGMLAVGAYSGVAGLYDLGSAELLLVLQGHQGGITQVTFSPDGNYLYTGARRDGSIFCWDVRYASGAVYSLHRDSSTTNQRVAFDIEPCGRHLATGGEDGKVRAFDLSTGEMSGVFDAAADTVNGCSVHPSLPVTATASGHRRLEYISSDSDDEHSAQARVPSGTTASNENCLQIWRFACCSYANAVDLDANCDVIKQKEKTLVQAKVQLGQDVPVLAYN